MQYASPSSGPDASMETAYQCGRDYTLTKQAAISDFQCSDSKLLEAFPYDDYHAIFLVWYS